MWILQEEIPEHVGVFIDDGGIKGPRSTYGGQRLKENPGIRRFIWEYAVTLERVLFRIEEAGLTVSGKKFSCCVPALANPSKPNGTSWILGGSDQEGSRMDLEWRQKRG